MLVHPIAEFFGWQGYLIFYGFWWLVSLILYVAWIVKKVKRRGDEKDLRD